MHQNAGIEAVLARSDPAYRIKCIRAQFKERTMTRSSNQGVGQALCRLPKLDRIAFRIRQPRKSSIGISIRINLNLNVGAF